MEKTVRDILERSLEDLKSNDSKKFRRKFLDEAQGTAITRRKIEGTKDDADLADLLLQTFENDAVDKTEGILRFIGCNCTASKLREDHAKIKSQGPVSGDIAMAASDMDDALERVSMVQRDLINRGSEGLLRDMLDSLQAERPSVINQWEVNEVLQKSSVLQDQWSSLLTMLQNKGEKACGIMLRVLKDQEYYLYEDLGL
ncbi:apoptosis-associated speck-like protein containing a CARD [Clupea harengus]|uniref:Apoptosis-associated speck-like protein containing a CARD n=1 Tax=Clupea harengus TaxID=7950 RepID=A0A6P8F7G3_CLUHA|nr:apoptosis-associated speck-like protein containing a CARD [Clupea harengus]